MSNKKKSLFSSSGSVELGVPLIMEVNTEDLSSADSPADSIILPFDEGNTVNLQIDWGDGTPLEPYTDTNLICTHQYALGGFYDIKIYNLNGVSRIPWNINNVDVSRRDYSKFYNLKQFGDCEIYQLLKNTQTRGFFLNENLDITANDFGLRCVEKCVEVLGIFQSCAIVEAKNSSSWDVSGVTIWNSMFTRNTNIIIDCSNWEMSQAKQINSIFSQCGNLNPDVTNWDISINCTNTSSAFSGLTNFERNLSNWDVSGVNDMSSMFSSCTSFTGQGLDTWITSALTNLQSTFQNCTSLTTVNLSSWDVSGVTTMNRTFLNCTNFVGNGLDSWATSSALTNLSSTFQSCTNFNGNLQNFDVSGVTTMYRAFYGCLLFEENGIENWATTSILETLEETFRFCQKFNANLQNFDVSGVVNMKATFYDCRLFEGNGIENWVTTNVTSLNQTFLNCFEFKADLSAWDVSNVTSFLRAFKNCRNLTGVSLENWDTSSLTNLFECFGFTSIFNADLSGWDFSNVTNMTNWGLDWGMDTNNYDKLLLSFASQTLQPNLTNVVMSSKYTAGEVTNGVTDSISTNKLIDSTQNFTSTVNVGDVIFNTTQDIYAEVVTVDSNTELTLNLDIMALGDSYSVEGSDVAKARYFVVKTYNWQIIDDGQAPAANTFIGGVGASTVTSAADFAALTDLVEEDIQSFSIDANNDVSFYVDKDYNTGTLLDSDNNATYFIDSNNNIVSYGNFSFISSSNVEYIYLNGYNGFNSSFRIFLDGINSLKRINLDSLTNFGGRWILNNATNLEKLYLPSVTITTQNNASYYNLINLTSLKYLYLGNLNTLTSTFTNWIKSQIGNFPFLNINLGCNVYYNSEFSIKDRFAWNIIQLGLIQIGDVFTLNGLIYTAINGTPTQDGEFDSSSSVSELQKYTNLKNAVNSDNRVGNIGNVSAISVPSSIILNIDVLGVTGNTVTASVNNLGGGTSSIRYSNFVGGFDVHPFLMYLRDERSANIVEVNNIISVPAPTNLSVTNLNNGSYQLDFTEPTPNANGTELYEVWAEALDNPSNPKNYFYYDTISTSGDSISGLDVNTRYKITVRTQDGQMQFSGFSNEITITTTPIPNTFIGGIGATLNTPALVADKFTDLNNVTLTDSDIQSFNIDSDNNVSFYYGGNDLKIKQSAFQNNNNISYFIYNGIRLLATTADNFRNSSISVFETINFNSIGNFGQVFRQTQQLKYLDIEVQRLYVSSCNGALGLEILKARDATRVDNAFVINTPQLKHLDIRSCVTYESQIATQSGNWAAGTKVYVPNSIALAPPQQLTDFITLNNAILVGVQNNTVPSGVIDLSASNITSNSIDLNFTTPSSTNTIQHYEVWAERQDLPLWDVERVKGKYTPKELISASGTTISGLNSNSTYKIYIITCDEYYNESVNSNEITITTL